jgi:hypothetical protein
MGKYVYFSELSTDMPSSCFTGCAECLVFLFITGKSGAGVQSWVLTLQCVHWPGLVLIHFYVCTCLLLLLLILYTLTLILCIFKIKKYFNFLSIGCCSNETAVAGVCSVHISYLYLMCGNFKSLSVGFLIPLIISPHCVHFFPLI